VVVEHPRGWALQLPVEWTDRAFAWAPDCIRGREVKFTVRSLLALAGAVEAGLSGDLDRPQALPKLGQFPEAVEHHLDAHPRPQDAAPAGDALEGSSQCASAKPAECLGGPRAQDFTQRKRRRGDNR
jgi:hypothetical protein